MIRKRLFAVPGIERATTILFISPFPMLAAVIIEHHRRIHLGTQEKGSILQVDFLTVLFLHLSQPHGGIVAPGSAVIVKNQ
jgi:hypothetical protein